MSLDQILMLPPGYGFDASNSAPTITVPGAQSAVSNVQLNITGTSISDAELSQTQTITLTVSHGTITIPNNAGLTWTVGDGVSDATMTFYGSQFNCNVGLSSILYTSTTDYVGADSLAISTNDGAGGTDSKTIVVTVTWTPASLSSLVAWFDPSYGVYSDAGTTPAVVNDPVYRWVCKNSSLYFEQATLSLRPILKQSAGGQYYIQFDGTNDYMRPSVHIAPSTSAGLGVLLNKVSTASNDKGWGRFTTDQNDHTNLTGGTQYENFGTTVRKSWTGPNWQGSWNRFVISSSSGNYTARNNGSQLYTTATNTAGGWALANAQAIGDGGGGNGLYCGDFGFSHLVISQALSAGDLASLEAYLLAQAPT